MNTEHQLTIRISMTCVSKEHEIKTKIVQQQTMTTHKSDVFIGL